MRFKIWITTDNIGRSYEVGISFATAVGHLEHLELGLFNLSTALGNCLVLFKMYD